MIFCNIILLGILCVEISICSPLSNGHSNEKPTHRTLRIAIVAPIQQSVPPKPGVYTAQVKENIDWEIEDDPVIWSTAQTVHDLVEGLIERGHDVYLFATADSRTSATLISDPAYTALRHARIYPGNFVHPYTWTFEKLRRFEMIRKFDVIHFHTIEHFPHIDSFIEKTLTTLYDQPGGATADQLNPIAELFPTVPVVVAPKYYKSASKHWKNLIAEDPAKEGISQEELAIAYEKIYAKIVNGEVKVEKYPYKKHARNDYCSMAKDEKLKIAIVTPPLFETIPVEKGGGTEKMVYLITETLVKQGHDVTLFAPHGSTTHAKLFEIPYKTDLWDCKGNWIEHILPVIFSQELVKRHAHEFDFLHFHDQIHAIQMEGFIEHTFVTMHGTIQDATLYKLFSRIPRVSISDEQQNLAAISGLDLHFVQTVHNAIDLEDFKFIEKSSSPEPYLAWMGRMVPEKGIDVAIKFAIISGIKLKIAAQLTAEKQKWWEKRIKPLIENYKDVVEFVGEVGGEERNRFLGNALAFLFTPKWDEPFGLTLIEAMATGTPVIAIERGAVPEIVIEGVNGYMFEFENNQLMFDFIDVDDLVQKVSKLDRKVVRKTVEKRWSLDILAKNYVTAYRKLLSEKC